MGKIAGNNSAFNRSPRRLFDRILQRHRLSAMKLETVQTTLARGFMPPALTSLSFLATMLLLCGCSRYYTGPVSDHFDGTRFFNPAGSRNLPRFAVWRWMLFREPAEWPEWVEAEQDKPPARVEGSALRISFVNHASVLIQTAGLNILTDPIWTERAGPLKFLGPKRVHAPGIAFDDLPRIDFVLVSHAHYDHLSIPTIKRLYERDQPRVLVGLGVDAIIGDSVKTTPLDWYQNVDAEDGVRIHFLPIQHWSARTLWDRNESLWGSYVIETPNGSIFFAGDCGYGGGEAFRKAAELFGGFRLALLPIGAYEPRWFMEYAHLNPEEAVLAHKALQARTSVPLHFGTFQLSDEPYEAPLRDLQAALERHEDAYFRVLKAGQSANDL